ncbi:PREDICTED: protein BIG GRAIN 1-like E [Camelina sativa]|uniref:Protein BIG GRAIN 1-like E n=1 Tax=Camelina sativa TaxID=90675 RepID=A0ABM0SSK7_CAMSA|nr:PREDICTED: protein BIG GRAIN 1-like E [Camelina sativa]
MSMKGISSAEPDKLPRRISLTHKRNSGELDVFEAAVYFSGYNEASSGDHRNTQKFGYNAAREENRRKWGILGGGGGGRRISLDLPIRCSEQVHHLHQDHHEVTTIKERLSNVRHKQPSSPGGKIASFLNSLFHQSGSKKNKSKSKSKATDPEVEEEVTGAGWMKRRRRSSISHFLSSSRSNSTTTTTTTTSSSSKSLISSSSSGFRTPPPYLNTPTKNYKQFLNYTSATKQVGEEEKKTHKDYSWLDEKLKVMESLSENQSNWAYDEDDDQRIKREGYDDGMESDSSSDLFELQNYELSRGGLPVYETTNVANINNTHI